MYKEMHKDNRRKISLTGIGMGAGASLTGEAQAALERCDCIIGADRMTEALSRFGKPSYHAYKAERIKEIIEEHSEYRHIAVALSGDCGFYSGAKTLAGELEEYETELIPGVSSVAYLAARLGVSWEDAALMSAHGRRQNYIYSIARSEKTFLLLGGTQCAEALCEKIRYYGLADVEFWIGRQLSYEDETIVHRTGRELKPEDCEGLDVAFVRNPSPDKRVAVHLPDDAFVRGEVPMTKSEVRSVSIGKLGLTKDAVLYDIGAGTGSVSVEAALCSGEIKVYAIEKNPEAVRLLEENRRRFLCDNIEIIEGTAPDAVHALEAPTHVFVGGSSGNLKAILSAVRKKNPGAGIVINAASLETVGEVMKAAEDGLLFDPEIVQIAASRARKLGRYHMMSAQNPVYVVSDGKGQR
ncbi:precorrin-6y C5,15-methyltransferase (decarboxylating) subunit CbiE [[Clostridium] hylemonae]|uniref:Precorrin-6Y C5,15-methyltransferase (Decarboxylating), CbiT subunit n=1 Tax=[Clostridium] hylemonae DSM 15053 TaxID=553973 RepID=C0BZA1_9FIRM|nr:precorrin-6y C5,15-methyltransferase (decarboxylating) subunit CbiE [[Clostridium] hylemonae]EEG74479.1 precorrin-6Y C5,15-methyltransferase (decarboxylating), CbiT subunit [[Clostridium] hylemonae DSM 15053]QEK18516.1 Cobalamin biosynthesis bifunctional protein CbiET [[Clostridium] hylemonae DSM 15053]